MNPEETSISNHRFWFTTLISIVIAISVLFVSSSINRMENSVNELTKLLNQTREEHINQKTELEKIRSTMILLEYKVEKLNESINSKSK